MKVMPEFDVYLLLFFTNTVFFPYRVTCQSTLLLLLEKRIV